jgi:hypothetical protein
MPAWLWRLLVDLLDVDCRPGGAGTSTTAATVPTSSRPPTTLATTSSRPPVSHVFRVHGVTGLATCPGSPAAPGLCGPAVGTAGQVRVGGVVADTGPDGSFAVAAGPPTGTVEVQAVLATPPGRVLDCPVLVVSRGDTRVDPVCSSFPVT